ncbi:hypothetical protein QR680_015595 [Steinernema hermaphroditum]|uniref:G-protein coupled receptors family 1 profile domain-containing protein n=1 Tax=Steinernema hermaphroditum TaxID=289476 RepID=A0AA39H8C0_9BILA|nr:hypothetical protein QR680_015595 [Steinernema hermaphroditum]
MGELDVVQEHWNGFELYRSIIIANTIVSLPLTALTVYLIIYKSSQHIKTYKYALLNILFCVFATDLLLEIVVLPAPVFDISAVYSTGLASLMGSKASFVCEVIAIASVAEYLAALLFAFFYRYLALKNDVYLCGKPIERRHYCGRSMAEVDIVQRYRHSFELYRWIIIANTVTALPLNALTVYLIIHKSPTHIKTYKYLLLNIMLCVFITDIMLEVVVLPAPVLHVFGIYPTGLVHVFGTKLGFVCEVIAIASVSEYLAALLFAFFYRYLALKDDLFICGKLIERQHYRAAMIVVMIIAPSTIAVALGMSYVPDDEFKEYVRESHPELLPFFDKEPFFQLSKRALSLTCGIFLCWTIIWTALVAWCVSGIVRQFRLQKSIMHINTYRLHVQLLKSLVVQTAAPIVLCAIPIVLVTCSVLLELNILDEVVKIADLTMSLHSTVNSLAVIVLIAPYRNAALNAFRKMSGRNVLTVSVIPGPHSV